MSDRDDNDARLLAETFHDDWASGRTAEFARSAAAHVRRRRRIQGTLSLAGAAAAAVALAVFVARDRWAASQRAPAIAARATTAVAITRGYDIISDEDLLAQLRDRPVLAVMRANGTRELFVLERETKPEPLE